MQQAETAVSRFVQRFAELNSKGTPEAAAGLFAATFLAAGPQGATCVRNEDFVRMLPKRKELFERAGWRKTELVAVEESMLGARYALAKTRWRFAFERSGGAGEDVMVESSFLVDCGVEPWRIVLYLAHQDIFVVLRERGMLKE